MPPNATHVLVNPSLFLHHPRTIRWMHYIYQDVFSVLDLDTSQFDAMAHADVRVELIMARVTVDAVDDDEDPMTPTRLNMECSSVILTNAAIGDMPISPSIRPQCLSLTTVFDMFAAKFAGVQLPVQSPAYVQMAQMISDVSGRDLFGMKSLRHSAPPTAAGRVGRVERECTARVGRLRRPQRSLCARQCAAAGRHACHTVAHARRRQVGDEHLGVPHAAPARAHAGDALSILVPHARHRSGAGVTRGDRARCEALWREG